MLGTRSGLRLLRGGFRDQLGFASAYPGMKRICVCLVVVACKGASDPPPSPAIAAPSASFVAPLAAPDAIEPPTREIVPGMTVAEAKARGARPSKYTHLEWRPDIDVWVDEHAQLVTSLQVTYKRKAWEALRASWGEPKIGNAWIGASWVATLNGCDIDCTLTFLRAPTAMFGDSVAPPLALANARAGMTPDQVRAAVGVDVAHAFELGYPLSADVRFEDGKLVEIDLPLVDRKQLGELADWLPALTSRWGKPVELGGREAWIGTRDHWIAVANHGDAELELLPYTPIADTVAGLPALAKATLGQARDAVSTVGLPRSELSLEPPTITLDYDDADRVSAMTVTLPGDPGKLSAFASKLGTEIEPSDDGVSLVWRSTARQ